MSFFIKNADSFKKEIEKTSKKIIENSYNLRNKKKNFKDLLNELYNKIFYSCHCCSCCCDYCFFCCKKENDSDDKIREIRDKLNEIENIDIDIKIQELFDKAKDSENNIIKEEGKEKINKEDKKENEANEENGNK